MLKLISPFALNIVTTITAIAIAWGMQMARIQELEKDLDEMQQSLEHHQENALMEKVVESLNRLEAILERK